jgi:hypothetical protein
MGSRRAATVAAAEQHDAMHLREAFDSHWLEESLIHVPHLRI